MNLQKDNAIKKLSDPLEEKILSPVFKNLNYNHHSPSSSEMEDAPFIYQKLFLTQEQRRLLDGNANMAAGVAVNDGLQFHYADTIWKMNPLTKKLQPQKNEKLSQDNAIQKVLEKFKEYNPVNEKDRDKFEKYQETIPQTIRQGFLACEKLGADKSKDVTAEASINNTNYNLQLPIVGRTDLHFKDFKSSEQSGGASASNSSSVLSVLEFKTVWHKPLKIKKDGSRGFSSARLPSAPLVNHLRQVCFYTVSLSHNVPCCPYLIYLSADGFQIYSQNNCADLEPGNIKNYYNQLVKNCIRRERLLTRYAHLNDRDAIVRELIADTQPNFSHPFYWNIGHEFVKQAKELWNDAR